MHDTSELSACQSRELLELMQSGLPSHTVVDGHTLCHTLQTQIENALHAALFHCTLLLMATYCARPSQESCSSFAHWSAFFYYTYPPPHILLNIFSEIMLYMRIKFATFFHNEQPVDLKTKKRHVTATRLGSRENSLWVASEWLVLQLAGLVGFISLQSRVRHPR